MRSRFRVLAVPALVGVFALAGGLAARADVCVKTDLGTVCEGPGPGRTSVVAQGGCCVLVDSTGPVPIGRTGIAGNGIQGLRADVIVYANGFETGRTTASPDAVDSRWSVAGQTVSVRAHVGCCVEIRASGPVTLARTGVHGDGEELTVWLDEERAYACDVSGGLPSRCKSQALSKAAAELR